jgi:hypothetical protein
VGEEGKVLPWKLVVSYSKFPDEWLMALDAEGKVVRDCYVNAVKEVSSSFFFLFSILFWLFCDDWRSLG